MKFWRLYNSAEKEVGFVPQIIQPIFQGQYSDQNQLWNVYTGKIDDSTIIPKGHLHKRANFTDLMSDGFLNNQRFVSNKLRSIIEKYPAEGIQFVHSEIFTKKAENIPVSIIHPFQTNRLFIDMKRSEFQIATVFGEIIEEKIKLSTINEFLEIRENHINESKMYEDISLHKWISISKLVFNEKVDFEICSVFDVMHGGGVGYYVSQNLKDDILNAECTGVIFREINERYPN
ncbi:MAG: hypothetical protein IPL97_00075 [Niastella sp.]|nr:hypothetical protein [Niastella sp.]